MRPFPIGRPSPAMVVSLIALFVSLGGVSYGVATGSIDSREIKNNTITSRDVRNNQVTGVDIRRGGVFGSDVHNSSLSGVDVKNDSLQGRDILESSLGTVPNATTASTANTAGALSSQKKLSYQSGAGGAATEIFNSGKLRLTASCGAGGAVTLTANTTVDNSTLQSFGTAGSDVNDSDFDAAETPTLSDADEERSVVFTEPGGQVVVIQYAAAEGAAVYGGTNCIVKGLAQTL
jgi:hypothetical protein